MIDPQTFFIIPFSVDNLPVAVRSVPDEHAGPRSPGGDCIAAGCGFLRWGRRHREEFQ